MPGTGQFIKPVNIEMTSPSGATVTSPADTVVGVSATVALTAPPAGTLRMTVQVTGGDNDTRVRIREVTGTAGTGILLNLLGSRVYGGGNGSIAALEAQHTAGGAATVAVQFEG
jgi:hypothetical protein